MDSRPDQSAGHGDRRAEREAMVDRTIAARGVRDPRVTEAVRSVPRELFVSDRQAPSAYEDHPLPIACGQTISQPYVVALMAEAAAIDPTDLVLEIGTGSGYGAAVLAHLADRVVTVERHADLARSARDALTDAGITNVQVVHDDGTLGHLDEAPYDAIVVTAAAPSVPVALVDQLADGGRLVMPVGRAGRSQELVCIERRGEDLVQRELGAVAFVPLVEGAEDDR